MCSVGTRGDETTQKKLRAVLLNSETNTLNDNEKWLDEHDYDLRDKAIRDFMKNYRSKKKWNRGERSFYSHSLLAVKDGCGRATTKYFNARFKALEEAVGRYFLITSNKGKEKRKNATRGDFVFIDPGVRTFLTCYDLNENVVEVGSGAVVRVSKATRLAALRNHKRRQNLQRAYIRLVEDMHKKAATFLCANYDMVEVKEERTSKSCSCCGWINQALGRSNVF
ncbi:hypothetical protein V1524DRAFT_444535 [Lipomyces starkeyi]